MYKTYDIALRVLNPLKIEEMQAYFQGILRELLMIKVTDEESCYSSEYPSLAISMGLNIFNMIFPEKVEPKDASNVFRILDRLINGLSFHEFGHLNETYFNLLHEYHFSPEVENFFARIMNITEDPTQEDLTMEKFPSMRKDILFTRKLFFSKTPKMLATLCDKLPLHPDTFLSFLLAKCREQELPAYSFYDKHKKFIDKSLFVISEERDGYERAKKELAFAQEILKLLINPEAEPDFQKVSDGKPDESSEELKDPLGSADGEIYDILSRTGDIEDSSKHGGHGGYSSSVETKDMPELKPQEPTQEDMKAIAQHNVGSRDRYPHVVMNLSDYYKYNSPEYVAIYQKAYAKAMQLIGRTKNNLSCLLAMNNGGIAHYQLAGKFNVRSAYEQGVWKLWDKKIKPKDIPKAFFLGLLDWSGSINSEKAYMEGFSMLVLGEALHALHIPFEIYAFTQNFYQRHEAVTVCFKSLTDDWNQAKYNLVVFLERLHAPKVYGFCDNTDEINVKWLGEHMKTLPYEEKHLIVLSDGATCGSAEDLADVVNTLERKYSIRTLGIGMLDDNVKHIYKNHHVLKNREQLEQLPMILLKYLKNSLFK